MNSTYICPQYSFLIIKSTFFLKNIKCQSAQNTEAVSSMENGLLLIPDFFQFYEDPMRVFQKVMVTIATVNKAALSQPITTIDTNTTAIHSTKFRIGQVTTCLLILVSRTFITLITRTTPTDRIMGRQRRIVTVTETFLSDRKQTVELMITQKLATCQGIIIITSCISMQHITG